MQKMGEKTPQIIASAEIYGNVHYVM